MSHYFIDDPGLVPDERRFVYYCGAARLDFVSDAGLFSHGHMDTATDLLLRSMTGDGHFLRAAEGGGAFLDLGCGWGAVGVSAGGAFPALAVTFADVNPRALRFAEKNALTNGVNGEFILSDTFESLPGSWDIIALNPPVHAGKEVCRAMLAGSAERLRPGGALYAVIHKKHGALSMADELAALFDVEVLHKNKGIFVFRFYPRRASPPLYP